jgi:SOS-response transcriptional repressor LexA
VGKHMTDAILTLMKYVRDTTGIEPSQEEIANALKSYFILNEIRNQINFQRKKPIAQNLSETSSKEPFWTLNLMASSPRNTLVRAGLFYEDIQAAIKTTQDFVKKSSGDEPGEAEIALSLKSSFILSEIKNQIDWQRQGVQKTDETEFSLD